MAGSWVCTRCGVVNAPHANQCTCPRKVDAAPVAPPVVPPLEPARGPTIPRVERREELGRSCLSANAYGDVT